MDFRLRLLLWIPALTYEGVLLSGGRDFASLGQITTFGFWGLVWDFFSLVCSQSGNAVVRNSA